MRIYLSANWRSQGPSEIVSTLRSHGHEVYDYTDPSSTIVYSKPKSSDEYNGFSWYGLGLYEQTVPTDRYVSDAMMNDKTAVAFRHNAIALNWCDVCVLVLPSGVGAHLEAGWAVGAGKPLLILLPELSTMRPELMYGFAEDICNGMDQLLVSLSLLEDIKCRTRGDFWDNYLAKFAEQYE